MSAVRGHARSAEWIAFALMRVLLKALAFDAWFVSSTRLSAETVAPDTGKATGDTTDGRTATFVSDTLTNLLRSWMQKTQMETTIREILKKAGLERPSTSR